ncbi:MAG TPA: hypothetical protein V6C99_02895 [Oculatellaceae cyanobacterium]|jgi:hypothetical protein
MASGSKAYFQEAWFALVFLCACLGVGFLLFYFLMPPVDMSQEAVHAVAMAKLFAENRFLDAFTRFNQPPIYPLLLSCVIRAMHTTELPRLIQGFHQLNLGLYFASILLTYFFLSRQIRKPYTFIITALYTIAPATIGMAWDIGPYMTYTVISLAALIAVDYSLSQSSAMAGQITRGELVLCGSLLALSMLTHQAGYMVVIAFFFVMLKRFGLKHSATVLASLMLLISPFIGRDLFYVIRKPQPYLESSVSLIKSASDKGIFRTTQHYADRLLFSVAHHAVGDLNLSPLDKLDNSKSNIPNRIGISYQTWGRWTLGLIAIIGAIYGLYQYTGIGTLYLCAYVFTALVLFPQAGFSLAPVLALLLLYLYYGMLRTGEWMKRLGIPITRYAASCLTVWILLCTITTHFSQSGSSPTAQSQQRPKIIYMNTSLEPQTRLEEAQKAAARKRAMSWLKAHTEPSAKVAIPRPEAAKLLTGEAGSPAQQEAFQKELANYNYLVEENATEISSLRKKRGGLLQTKGLQLVYEDVPGRTRIWEIKQDMQ